MSLSTAERSSLREMPLPNFRARKAWDEEQDPLSNLELEYSAWLESLAENETLFRKHIYENADPDQTDYREHRRRLYWMLARGESLAMGFGALEGVEGAPKYVELIDQKLMGLRDILQEWHGPMNDLSIPESFRQGLYEAQNRIGLEAL